MLVLRSQNNITNDQTQECINKVSSSLGVTRDEVIQSIPLPKSFDYVLVRGANSIAEYYSQGKRIYLITDTFENYKSLENVVCAAETPVFPVEDFILDLITSAGTTTKLFIQTDVGNTVNASLNFIKMLTSRIGRSIDPFFFGLFRDTEDLFNLFSTNEAISNAGREDEAIAFCKKLLKILLEKELEIKGNPEFSVINPFSALIKTLVEKYNQKPNSDKNIVDIFEVNNTIDVPVERKLIEDMLIHAQTLLAILEKRQSQTFIRRYLFSKSIKTAIVNFKKDLLSIVQNRCAYLGLWIFAEIFATESKYNIIFAEPIIIFCCTELLKLFKFDRINLVNAYSGSDSKSRTCSYMNEFYPLWKQLSPKSYYILTGTNGSRLNIRK